jgi:hypothetical protein
MNPPIIYLTNPFTGEYAGTEIADPDPLVPGEWVLPAGAYFDAPPASEPDYAYVRVGDVWERRPDQRGAVYWDAEGVRYEITALGFAVPEGALLQAPPPSLTVLAATARTRRDGELLAVSSRLSVLGYAAELGVATNEELAEAQLLKYYSVLLSRIEGQPGFPAELEWPDLRTLTLPEPEPGV